MGEHFMISFSRLSMDNTLRSDPTFFSGSDYIKTFMDEHEIETFPLGESIVKIRNGIDIKQIDYSLKPTRFVYVSVSEIKEDGLDFNDPTYILEDHGASLSNLFLKEGEILITRSGTVGISLIFHQNDSNFYIPSGYTFAITVNEKKVFPPFLIFYLNSSIMKFYFNTCSSGSNTPNITQKVIEKLPFPNIAIEVQKEIFEIMDKRNQEIIKLRQSIPNTQEVIERIFTNYLGFSSCENDLDKGNKSFVVSFAQVPLNDSLRCSARYIYFKNVTGNLIFKSRKKYPIVKLAEMMYPAKEEKLDKGFLKSPMILIDEEDIDPKTGIILNEEFVEKIDSDKIRFGDSDILFSKIRPYLGHVILNDKRKPYIGTTELVPFKIKADKTDLRFLEYLLLSGGFLNSSIYLMSGKLQPRIRPSELMELKVPLPTLSEQNTVVEKIYSEIENITQKRKDISSMKDEFDRTLIDLISHKSPRKTNVN